MIVERLSGKAKLAVSYEASIVAMEGSVRSGKTWASLLAWLEYCRRGPAGPLLMTGRTERTIINNLILPLQQMLGEKRVKLNRGLGMVQILGRDVMMVGANNEASVTKIQGRTLAGAYIDEASSIPESFFAMLYSRLSIQGARLYLTSNPDTPAHWLKANWLDKARLWIDGNGVEHENPDGLDLVRVSFRLEDNPNLPQSYVDRVKAAYSGLWYKRYIEGEWVIAAGAIYTDWDPARHVVQELPAISRLVSTGIDYGTTNATAGLLIGISAESPARLVVADEWAPPTMTDSGLSADYRKWIGSRHPEWVCVDPSAASFKMQLFADGVSSVTDGANAVVSGIRTVASLLATDRLVVSDKCVNLIKEIPAYAWDPKATAKGEDAPIKLQDHFCDALRYSLATTRQLWGMEVPVTMKEAA